MNLQNEKFFENLAVDQVFAFYDMPRIFTCKAPAGQKYLAINVDEDDESATWLYLAVSDERLKELCFCDFDLREAVLFAEDGVIWQVVSYADRAERDVCYLEPSDVPIAYLPEAGQLLCGKSAATATGDSDDLYQESLPLLYDEDSEPAHAA